MSIFIYLSYLLNVFIFLHTWVHTSGNLNRFYKNGRGSCIFFTFCEQRIYSDIYYHLWLDPFENDLLFANSYSKLFFLHLPPLHWFQAR